MSVRPATESDLDDIVSLTTAYRDRLAGWAPVWWRKSSTADKAHPGWLAHMLRSPQFTIRVVEVDGVVEGCAVSVPQRAQWVIDDVAVVDDRPLADQRSRLARRGQRAAGSYLCAQRGLCSPGGVTGGRACSGVELLDRATP